MDTARVRLAPSANRWNVLRTLTAIQMPERSPVMQARLVAMLIVSLFIAACGSVEDPESSVDPDDDARATLAERIEGMSRALDGLGSAGDSREGVTLPAAGGEYAAGWFTGRCEKKGRPEQPAIGQTYQVVAIETDFFLWVDDRWDFDARVMHPTAGPGYEYVCAPESDRIMLPARFVPRDQMPVSYRMVTRGTIATYEVEECRAVVGGPCPIHVGTEEIRDEVEFTVTR
jgi:hypothetical protein